MKDRESRAEQSRSDPPEKGKRPKEAKTLLFVLFGEKFSRLKGRRFFCIYRWRLLFLSTKLQLYWSLNYKFHKDFFFSVSQLLVSESEAERGLLIIP